MEKNRLADTARNIVGTIKEAFGKATLDKPRRGTGKKGQAKSRVQRMSAPVKDTAKKSQ
jgi:uncharacterized protein YjbJ (UPF0337 family)